MQDTTFRLRTSRLLAAAFGLCLATMLGGCGSIPSWDPTDLLDFLDTKKRAVGERKPVFPEGVPGISQGVPKEMIRGSAEQQAASQAQAAAAEPPPVETKQAPPPKRAKTAAKRPPRQAPVEIAPDDVNVEDTPAPQPARQAQQPRPFPAPLPR